MYTSPALLTGKKLEITTTGVPTTTVCMAGAFPQTETQNAARPSGSLPRLFTRAALATSRRRRGWHRRRRGWHCRAQAPPDMPGIPPRSVRHLLQPQHTPGQSPCASTPPPKPSLVASTEATPQPAALYVFEDWSPSAQSSHSCGVSEPAAAGSFSEPVPVGSFFDPVPGSSSAVAAAGSSSEPVPVGSSSEPIPTGSSSAAAVAG